MSTVQFQDNPHLVSRHEHPSFSVIVDHQMLRGAGWAVIFSGVILWESHKENKRFKRDLEKLKNGGDSDKMNQDPKDVESEVDR